MTQPLCKLAGYQPGTSEHTEYLGIGRRATQPEPHTLGRAGLGAEAVMVGDALAEVDPDSRVCYEGEVVVALAEASFAEEARIEARLARWPDDFWIRVHVGDALAALGDLDGAQAHFCTALSMTEQADDFEARYDAIYRLRKIGRGKSQDERGQRRQARRKLGKSQRKR